MMTPAHFFGGYIALKVGERFWVAPELTKPQTVGLLIYGLILSVAIDLDVLVTGGITGHHKQLTHYPFFWLVLSSIIISLGKYLKQPFLKSLAIVTFIATWTHLALDLVGVTMGIHWFWPFSNRELSVTPLQQDFASEQDRWNYIMKSPVVWVGDTIIVVSGLVKMAYDAYKGSVK